MGREFELKYAATPAQQDALQRDFALSWQEFAMETTYYDTAAGDLGLLHWTLRRRFENGRSVCTVKTPDIDGGRGEWELECDNILDAIPELCKLGGPNTLMICAAMGVQEVCGARFTRQAAALEIEGAVVEIALDRGVLTGGGKEIPLCEIEVELKEGSDAAAIAFAAALAEKYGLKTEHRSKYRRALTLAKEI